MNSIDSISKQITTIMSENPGQVFSIHDFYDLGTKNTVKSVLYRLCKEKKIARLIDGLYTKPKYSKTLDEYAYPDTRLVARKIAEKFSWTISPAADNALNYTGLCTQVSNAYVFVSDGPYREYSYRNKKIIFKHTNNRNIASCSRELALMIQAIKALGKGEIRDYHIEQLAYYARRVQVKEDLAKDTLKLPFWIHEVLKQVQAINQNKKSKVD